MPDSDSIINQHEELKYALIPELVKLLQMLYFESGEYEKSYSFINWIIDQHDDHNDEDHKNGDGSLSLKKYIDEATVISINRQATEAFMKHPYMMKNLLKKTQRSENNPQIAQIDEY